MLHHLYAQASRTKPILHFVEDGEKAIDGEALLAEALEHVEMEWVYPD